MTILDVETQHCGACKQQVSLELFSPSYRGRPGTWCRACFAAYARGQRVAASPASRECDFCGISYVPVSVRSRFCSQVCKTRARNTRQSKITVEMKSNAPRLCRACRSEIPAERRADTRYCNEACMARGRQIEGRQSLTRRRHILKKQYGMTLDDFDRMLAEQGGRCAICGSDDPRQQHGQWSIDHCHDTGAVRGLLCGPCNTGIGQLADDPARLRAAADYIERSRHHA